MELGKHERETEECFKGGKWDFMKREVKLKIYQNIRDEVFLSMERRWLLDHVQMVKYMAASVYGSQL